MRRDTRGVEGLPLRLLITAAVLALTLPAVASALVTHDLHRTEERVRGEALRVLDGASRLALAGGGRIHLTLDVRSGALTGVEWVRFRALGGTGVAEYQLVGQSPRPVTLNGVPALQFASADGLTLGPGIHTLRLEFLGSAGVVAVSP